MGGQLDEQADGAALRTRVEALEQRLRKRDEQRRALLHLLGDLNEFNKRLGKQRKAMIHIMGDLRETTAEMQRREQELREKQEQLVQAAKLATLGELTTGVAHELNNPLNNIGLFVGNAIDLIQVGGEQERALRDLRSALTQVRKATEIITHLRTFGRAAPASREPVVVKQVVERALSLMQEQLRLRQIDVELDFGQDDITIIANAIQLEQVFINLLTNARDALADWPRKGIRISCHAGPEHVEIVLADTGPGIPRGLEKRIFDPFFTTKDVGKGTGLGLSITYGIIKDHGGSISVCSPPAGGARFLLELPVAGVETWGPRGGT